MTLRTFFGVGYLRGWRLFQVIQGAIRGSQERFGMRVVHFSVQGNHLHLLVEADGPQSLSRGMQGLTIRIARALNRAAGRHGKVFTERYHAHVLSSRREVAYAFRYVLENFRHHLRPDIAPEGGDPCSSAAWVESASAEAPVRPPRTWLLQNVLGPQAEPVAVGVLSSLRRP